MKNLVTSVFLGLFTAAVLVPVTCSFAGTELYGWTVSSSSTDPFMHIDTPETGLYSLYVWLVCITEEEFRRAVFHLGGSLEDRIVGVNGIPPFNVTVTSDLDLVPLLMDGLCFSSGVHLALEVLIFDDAGTGGNLCIVGTIDGGVNESCNCEVNADCFPNAVTGFASDGTAPCVTGSCQIGPITVEDVSWGATKGKYR